MAHHRSEEKPQDEVLPEKGREVEQLPKEKDVARAIGAVSPSEEEILPKSRWRSGASDRGDTPLKQVEKLPGASDS